MQGEWWKEAHQDESCLTSAASNVEHHVGDALTTLSQPSVPEMVATADSTMLTNGRGKTSWLSSGDNASSKQGEEKEFVVTTERGRSYTCNQPEILSPSSLDYSQQSKQSGQREETKQEVLLARSFCVNAGGRRDQTLVRAKDDPFGPAIAKWRRSKTANDTKPFPLKGQDREAEQWLAVQQQSRVAAAAERC